MISFKPLWILLASREMNKTSVCDLAHISPTTYAKMRKNKYVSTEFIDRLCKALDCNISDVIEFVPEEEDI